MEKSRPRARKDPDFKVGDEIESDCAIRAAAPAQRDRDDEAHPLRQLPGRARERERVG